MICESIPLEKCVALRFSKDTYFKSVKALIGASCQLWQSDPMVVVYYKRGNGILEELGRTEVCLNSLDPCWIMKIRVTYSFEELQVLLYVTLKTFFNYSRIVLILFSYTITLFLSSFVTGLEFMMWIRISRMLKLR